jgi:hypothetical protein
LSSPKLDKKDKTYLKDFLEFLNPYNADAQLKPLMQYLLKIKKGSVIQVPIFPDPFGDA